MELEFDKEMDTILRRAGRGVLVGDEPPRKPKHLDADEIAAFVENALPSKTRSLYIEHFADCNACRKVLATTMLMAGEAFAPADSVVEERQKEAIATAVPWYRKLFRTPNLAIAMGALVLTFGGVLAFVVMQNRQSDNASVARVIENETRQSGPSAGDGITANMAAPAANAVPDQHTASNTNSAASAAVPGAVAATPAPAKPASVDETRGITLSAGIPADVVSGGEDKEEERQPIAKGAAPPPPRPAVTDEVEAERVEKKAEPSKDDEDAKFSAKRKQTEEARSRDVPAAPAKGGPARSGPMNTQQNQISSQNMAEMPVTRTAGGKTFNNRNGAWYDTEYKNQATMNFRRGTDEYKKLESGLRNIADSIGGTVVLVWKARAYRIQ